MLLPALQDIGIRQGGNMMDYDVNYLYFAIIITIPNVILSILISRRLYMFLLHNITEAQGGRSRENIYSELRHVAGGMIYELRKHTLVKIILETIQKKAQNSGYSSKRSVYRYVVLKFLLPLLVFSLSVLMNYPNFIRSLAGAVIVYIIIDMMMRTEKRKRNQKFQLNAYRIYKYLHNQTTAGVKTTDAIKTVYEVADDIVLKEALIKMAASFELTMDIDRASEELLNIFDTNDAQTLCASLKLGVDTGDNTEILARQEELMFKKYFNYIQAETDSCRTRCVLAAILFTSIIVIMISIPLLKDVTNSVEKIFVG